MASRKTEVRRSVPADGSTLGREDVFVNPWVKVLLVLLAFSLPIQLLVFLKMKSDRDGGFYDTAERRGMDFASYLALAAFLAFAFLPPFFASAGDFMKFVGNYPFKPIYLFARTWLAVPDGRSDIAYIYIWIWRLLAFVLPCVVFVVFHMNFAAYMWDKVKSRGG